MGIKDYKLLCQRGSSEYNEDIVGINEFGAWVLDGSTGLNNKNLISDKSDASWYVSWWNKYLETNLNQNKSLKQIILEGIETIKKDYLNKLKNVKIEKLDMPSSSIVVIKFHKSKIEYFMLGDCTLIVESFQQQTTVKDERVCKFDNIIFEKMKRLNNIDLNVVEKKNILLPNIIENRLKKNTEEGYWILEFDEKAVEKSIYGYMNINEEVKILMSSDGFSCAFDKYNIFDEEEIIKVVENNGIEYINDEIRKLEREDEKGLIFPRFKTSDDSSCIYLHIEE